MSLPLLPIALGSAAIDTIVVVGVLGLVRPRRAGPGPVVDGKLATRAGFAALAAATVQSLALIPFGLDFFGMVHLWYVALVIAIPIGSIVLVARRRGAATRSASLLAAAGVLGAPVGVHATFIAPFDLQAESASIPVSEARAGRDPVRVAVFADLQTPSIDAYEREAVDRVLALEPDVVLMPGDVYQRLAGSGPGLEDELPKFRELLSRLAATPGGLFISLGNVDDPAVIEAMVQGTRAKLLVNSAATVHVRDRTLSILGLDLDVGSAPARAALGRFLDDPRPDDIRIVVSHLPDAALLLPSRSRADLVVAGHTHGGQVVVPGFGPPMTLTAVPRDSAAGGLSFVNGNALYVSRGVGLERNQAPRIRFLCPPEISLLLFGG